MNGRGRVAKKDIWKPKTECLKRNDMFLREQSQFYLNKKSALNIDLPGVYGVTLNIIIIIIIIVTAPSVVPPWQI